VFRNKVIAIVCSLCFLEIAKAESIDRLIVVVEQADWVCEAKKIACHKTDFRIWESGVPMSFGELSKQDAYVLVLFDPQGSRHEQEMWRERLKTQGCKLVSLKIDRSTGKVSASEIHKSVHSVLLEVFPDKKSLWNENLQRAMRFPPVPPNLQSLSWFAAFDRYSGIR
jgi:hypothetical protein